jgi:hypothetical protein
MVMSRSTTGWLLLVSAFVVAPSGCAPAVSATAPRILTEISLVSVIPGFNSGSPGEVSRFLWEPQRYAPPPTEMFFEVAAAVFGPSGGSATFRLHDVTNNLPIANSSLTINAGGAGRLRSVGIASSFPPTPAEIALVVERTVGVTFSIQRSAVLVQQ